jgi:hypothetical protein
MQIDLVSYKKKKVKIEYTNEIQYGGNSHQDPMSKKSSIPPTPEFIKALRMMADFVAHFGVDNNAAESTKVHKVDIGREKEKLTIVLHVIQETKKTNAPFEFKTPKVNETEDAWSEEVSDAVIELMIQAEKYLNGEYAQTELEFEGADPDGKNITLLDTEPENEGMTIVGQKEVEEPVAATG